MEGQKKVLVNGPLARQIYDRIMSSGVKKSPVSSGNKVSAKKPAAVK